VLKTQLRLYDWGHYYEKMLYDNAQLARAYLHRYQITNDLFFKRIVTETLDFLAHKITHSVGGFIPLSMLTQEVKKVNSIPGLSKRFAKHSKKILILLNRHMELPRAVNGKARQSCKVHWMIHPSPPASKSTRKLFQPN